MQPIESARDEWVAARKQLLVQKQLTHLRDELAQNGARCRGSRSRSDTLMAPDGKKILRICWPGASSSSIISCSPGLKDGCIGCSFLSDHINGALVHLEHHDVSLIVVSRAPITRSKLIAGAWGGISRVSSNGDFNYDYHVSFSKDELAKGKVNYNYTMIDPGIDELSGMSVFYKDENGDIFHTYSSYARGGEDLLTTYMVLDRTPKGRDETGPHRNLMDWVRRHDEYDDVEGAPGCHAS
jgi:predicted dithiol-disulfide oxidoreductase (DUF899 family)